MQVEVPPWVTQWLSAAEWRRRQRERDRRLPGLTLYAYGPYGRDPPNQVQPIFRIGGYPEGHDRPRFGAGGAGGAAAGDTGWMKYPLDPFLPYNPNDLSHLPINPHGTRQRVNVEWLPPPTPRGPPSPPGPGGDGGMLSGRAALRAWVFGSALVVLVLVLVRAIDKCLTVNLLKSRRRSQEWPTPNVRATSHQEADISTVMITDSEGNEPRPADYSDVLSVDLPPPYSECAATTTDNDHTATTSYKLPDYEDPPPAYSDTYVEFSNKNGVPSVLIYSRRRTPLVNRRDIIGSEGVSIDLTTSSELNVLNIENNDLNREETNENDENNEIESETDATLSHTEGNGNQNNTTNTNGVVSNSNSAPVDVAANIDKDVEIMV